MWSSACLEARENVLLLILLPVFDTGSFIANLYLSYLLDELRGWLFVSTGLASSSGIGKKHRPNDYFTKSRQGIPLITGRFDPLAQLDSFSRSFIRRPPYSISKLRSNLSHLYYSAMVGCSRTSCTYPFLLFVNISNAVHPTRKLIRIRELRHNQTRTNKMLN
jgi:cytochrome b559 alpha subunit